MMDRNYRFIAKYSDQHGRERSVTVIGYRAGPFAIAETINHKGELQKVIQTPSKHGMIVSGGRWRIYHVSTGLWATRSVFETSKLAKKIALEVEMSCPKDKWKFIPDPDDMKAQEEFANAIVCRFKGNETRILMHNLFGIVEMANGKVDTPARREAIEKVDYILHRQQEARINANQETLR